MKKLLCATILLLPFAARAQVKIGNNQTTVDPSSLLELEHPNKALYLNRVSLNSTSDVTTVPSPKAGMVVYNSNGSITASNPAYGASGVGIYYFDGTGWVYTGNGGLALNNTWNLLGNSNAVDGINFLGTTNNVALNFRINNTKAGRLDLNGNTFFGYQAGANQNTALNLNNTLIGSEAGAGITNGSSNVAVGTQALQNASLGFNNIGVGYRAGATYAGTGVHDNTLIGNAADVTSASISGSTAIGSGATVSQSNSVILGTSATSVGIGNTAPTNKLHVTGTDPLRLQTLTSTTINPNPSTEQVVTVDASGVVHRTPVAAILSPITASNGLTRVGNDIQLGGTLAGNTTVDVNGSTLDLFGTAGSVKVSAAGGLNVTGTSGLNVTNNANVAGTTTSGNFTTTGLTTTGTMKATALPGGASNDDVVTIDASNNVRRTPIATLGVALTANNGLTKTGNNIQLGGPLTQATTITTAAGQGLTIAGAGGLTVGGPATTTGITNTGNITNSGNTTTGTLNAGPSTLGNTTTGTLGAGNTTIAGTATVSGNATTGSLNTGSATVTGNTTTSTLTAGGLSNSVTPTNSLLNITAGGVVEKVSPAALVSAGIQADNGVSVGTTGANTGKVILGGTLNTPTTISTSPANSLTIGGTGNLNVTNAVNAGSASVTGNTTTGTLNSGSATVSGNTTTGTLNSGSATVTGNTTSGTLNVGGLSTTNGISNTGNIATTANTSTSTLTATGLAAGTATDELVTVTAGGIVNRRPISSVVTASNGLNAVGGDVRLGGTLNTPTTIATAGNNLSLTGAGNLNVAAGVNAGSANVTGNTTTGTLNSGSATISGNTNTGTLTAGASTLGNTTTGTLGAGNTTISGTANVSGATTSGSFSTAGNTTTGTLNATALPVGAITDEVVTLNGSTVRRTPLSVLGGIITADNGLTKTGNNIQLGGTLLNATNITTGSGKDLNINGTGNLNVTNAVNAGSAAVTGNTTTGTLNAGASTLGATSTGALTSSSANVAGNTTTSTLTATGLAASATPTDDVLNIGAGNVVKRVSPQSLVSAGLQADNGLTVPTTGINAGKVILGGTLNQATTIANGGFPLAVTGSGGSVTVGTTGANLTVTGAVNAGSVNAASATIAGNTSTGSLSAGSATVSGVTNLNGGLNATIASGTATESLVTIDPATKAVHQNTLNNLGAITTASNGLTKVVNDVQLGGTLTHPTTITTAGNSITIAGTGNLLVGADINAQNVSAGNNLAAGNNITAGGTATVTGFVNAGSLSTLGNTTTGTLNITNSVATGNAANDLLNITSGGVVERVSPTAILAPLTASNGLTRVGNDFQLGGSALSHPTTVTTDATNTLTLAGLQAGAATDAIVTENVAGVVRKVSSLTDGQVDNNLTITNGTITASPISGSTGSFTTLGASGATTLTGGATITGGATTNSLTFSTQPTNGTSTNNVLNIDGTTGLVQKVSPTALVTAGIQAKNGVNIGTGGDAGFVKLGGNLTDATTAIGTDASHTLAVTGLQTGAGADVIVTEGAGGVLRQVASLTDAQVNDNLTINGGTITASPITTSAITASPISGSTGSFTTLGASGATTLTGGATITGGATTNSLTFSTQPTNGTSTNNVLNIDGTTGLVQKVSPTALVTAGIQAKNGVNIGTGGDAGFVKLGGNLTDATTAIGTDASHTLAVTGLQTGAGADVIVTEGAGGVLRQVASLTDAQVDNSLTIVGGSVNNSPIGATTASTGAFTTLSSTGTTGLNTTGAAATTIGNAGATTQLNSITINAPNVPAAVAAPTSTTNIVTKGTAGVLETVTAQSLVSAGIQAANGVKIGGTNPANAGKVTLGSALNEPTTITTDLTNTLTLAGLQNDLGTDAIVTQDAGGVLHKSAVLTDAQVANALTINGGTITASPITTSAITASPISGSTGAFTTLSSTGTTGLNTTGAAATTIGNSGATTQLNSTTINAPNVPAAVAAPTSTTNIVTKGTAGVLETVTAQSLVSAGIQAANGVKIGGTNPANAGKVTLGSALNEPTTITTDLTNTLTLAGVQPGAGSDVIVTQNAGGTIRNVASLTDAQVDNSLTIVGGSVNSSPIGATTASTGAFTTLSSTGTTGLNTTGTAATTVGNNVAGSITNLNSPIVNAANLPAGTATSTSNIVTKGAGGLLETVTAQSLVTAGIQAKNGVNIGTGGDAGFVKLGGNLTDATTAIGTDASHTLAVTGLQTGAGADVIVTEGAGGVLRQVASLTDAQVDNSLTIVGGSVNNSPIGATTASTGAFTTLSSTGTTGLNTTGAAATTIGNAGATTQLNSITINAPNVPAAVAAPTSTTNIVTKGTAGVLETVTAQSLVSAGIQAANGVSVGNTNPANAGKVVLGGALNTATAIGTSSTNTLALTGLQTGTTADNIAVVDASTGIVRQRALNSVVTASNGLTAVNGDVRLGGTLNPGLTTINTGTPALPSQLEFTGGGTVIVDNKLTSDQFTTTTATVNSQLTVLGNSALGAASAANLTVGSAGTGSANFNGPINATGLIPGTATDEIVTINGNSVRRTPLSTLAPSFASALAGNGLTANGSKIDLGGTLTAPVVLGTSASNTITVSGLQNDLGTDAIVTQDATGVLHKSAVLTDAQVANALTINGGTINNSPITNSSITGSTGSFTTLSSTGTTGLNTTGAAATTIGNSGATTQLNSTTINAPNVPAAVAAPVSTTNVVTKGAAGVLETVTAQSLVSAGIQAANGVKIGGTNPANAGKVTLGSALNEPTTITTDLTNTLTLAGLQPDAGSDAIVTSNGGVLRKSSSLTDGQVDNNLTINGGSITSSPITTSAITASPISGSTGSFTTLSSTGTTGLNTTGAAATTIGNSGATTQLNSTTINAPNVPAAVAAPVSTTNVVTKGAAGVLETVTAQSLVSAGIQAANGLSVPTTGINAGKVILQGALNQATTVTTDATNTLSLAGLQPDAGTDAIVTSNGGVLRKSASLTDAQVDNSLTIVGGSVNNSPIGAATASTGAFTTLSSNSTTTLGATTATSINSTPIGQTTAAAGSFTTLSSTGATGLNTTGAAATTIGNAGATTQLNSTTINAPNVPAAVAAPVSTTNVVTKGAAGVLETVTAQSLVSAGIQAANGVKIGGTNPANAGKVTLGSALNEPTTITTDLTNTLTLAGLQPDAGSDAIVTSNGGVLRKSASLTDAQVDNSLTIVGGSVNNSPIGAATASTGAFTTLSSTGTTGLNTTGTATTTVGNNVAGSITNLNSPVVNAANLPAGTATSTTSLVTKGAGGLLETVSAQALVSAGIQAANGLSVPTTGINAGKVILQGALNQATTVTTDATNTLSLAGLQPDAGTDAIVTSNGGVLRKSASLTDAQVDNSLTIVGGSVNNSPIGAATASTGAFTTLSSTGTTGLNTTGAAATTIGNSGATTQLNSTTINAPNVPAAVAAPVSTTNVVTKGTAGVLETVTAQSLVSAGIQAANGLSVPTTGINAGKVILQGALNQATTVTTDATNTLSLAGLQPDAGTDAIVTSNGGVLRKSASLTDAQVDNSLTIVGGSVNNSPIGATTASTGAFTTLSSTGTTGLNTTGTAATTVGNSGATTQLNSTTINAPNVPAAVAAPVSTTNVVTKGAAGLLETVTAQSLVTAGIQAKNGVNIGTGGDAGFVKLGGNLTDATTAIGTDASHTLAVTGLQTGAGADVIVTEGAGGVLRQVASLTDAQVNDNLTINAGTINSSPIGATTASTGAFTTLSSTGTTGLNTTGTAATTVGNNVAGSITNLNSPVVNAANLPTSASSTDFLLNVTTGGQVEKVDPATIVGVLTGSNGVQRTGNDFHLGGTLTSNVAIATAGFNVSLTGTGPLNVGGAVNANTLSATGNATIGGNLTASNLESTSNTKTATITATSLPAGAATDEILTITGTTGNNVRRTSINTLGFVNSADNGLTQTGNNVRLGGALVAPTTITAGSTANSLNLDAAGFSGGVRASNLPATTSPNVITRNTTNNGLEVGDVVTVVNSSSNLINAPRIAAGLTNTQVNDDLTISGGSITNSPITNSAISGNTGSFTTLTSSGTTTLGATTAASLDNTPIGAGTRSSGAFTTLTANGATTLTGATTDISSATTTIGSAATTTNLNAPTIHVPALVAGTAVTVVGLDATNNLVKTNAATSASNGLTLVGNDVQLGGTLTQNTLITANANTALNLAGANDGLTGDALYNVDNITASATAAPAYQMGIAASSEYNGTGTFIDATTMLPGIGVVAGASNEARTTNLTYQAIGADNLASVDPATTVTGNFPHAIGASGIGVSNGVLPATGTGSHAVVLGLSGGTGFDAGSASTSNWNGVGTEGYLDYNHGTTGRAAGGYFNGNNYDASNNLIGTTFGVVGSIGDNPSSSYQAMFNAPLHMHAAVAAVNTTATPGANDLALYADGNTSLNGSTTLNGSQSVRIRPVGSNGDAVVSSDYFVILRGATVTTFDLSSPATSGKGRELIIKNLTGAGVTSSVGFIPNAGGSAIFTIPVGTIHLINDGDSVTPMWQQVD